MAGTVMAGWLSMLQLLAVIGFAAVAFGLMLGIAKPGSALKHLGMILDTVIALTLLPGIALTAWSRLLLWEKLGLTAVLVALLLLRPSQR